MKYNDENEQKKCDSSWMDRCVHRNGTHYGRRPSRREARREELLRDWHGPEKGKLEILEHQSSARGIRDLLREMLVEFDKDEAFLLDRFQAEWPELVGREIARYSCPAAVRDGVLCIETSDASWQYVLASEHKAEITRRVRNFSRKKIRSIYFVPAGRYRSTGGD